MPRNPAGQRNYSGLHLPPNGGVPQIGQQQEQIKTAIAREMQAIAREIFVRSASTAIAQDFEAVSVRAEQLDEQQAKYFANLAAKCQVAARSYFVGIGLIEIEQPDEDPGIRCMVTSLDPLLIVDDEEGTEHTPRHSRSLGSRIDVGRTGTLRGDTFHADPV